MIDAREHGAREVLERIVRMAIAYGRIEGSSSMEVAASTVSYLAAHLEVVPGFMRGVASPNEWPPDWGDRGDLTWRRSDGPLHDPGEDVRNGGASSAASDDAAIVHWLRRRASKHQRQTDDVTQGLAARREHERRAAHIDELVKDIERGAYREPPGRPSA